MLVRTAVRTSPFPYLHPRNSPVFRTYQSTPMDRDFSMPMSLALAPAASTSPRRAFVPPHPCAIANRGETGNAGSVRVFKGASECSTGLPPTGAGRYLVDRRPAGAFSSMEAIFVPRLLYPGMRSMTRSAIDLTYKINGTRASSTGVGIFVVGYTTWDGSACLPLR